MWAAVIAGAAAGFASIPHCTAMCGPLAAYACSSRPTGVGQARYQLGRFISYAALGAVVGTLSGAATVSLPEQWGKTLLSWSLALGLALAAYRLWRRPKESLVALRTKPSVSRSSIFASALGRFPFLVGLATALLPCGALATAALIAASTGTPWLGALSMLAFSVVSGVGLVGASWLFERLASRPRPSSARVLAVVLALGAIIFVIRPVHAFQHGAHAGAHAPSGSKPIDYHHLGSP
jgi:sulfite exporter TauE/SafE